MTIDERESKSSAPKDISPLDNGVLDNLASPNNANEKGPFNTLLVRSLTGIVYVGVIVGCLIGGPIFYLILFGLLTGFLTWEFCTIINAGLQLSINRFITTIASVYFFFSMFDYTVDMTGKGVGIFIPFVLTLMYLLISEMYFPGYRKIENWAFSFMAFLYISLPMSMTHYLLFISSPDGMLYTWIVLLSVFIFLWVSDSGAYLIGSLFGRHRLFPSVSPKKSWEGSIGGGLLAMCVSQLIASFSDVMNSESTLQNHLLWLGLSVVVVVFGTWGDLVESRLKRKLGVKDSGNILPGHGGWLDRLDSALMAIPASVIYLYFV